MKRSIQFSVVREDPMIEDQLIRDLGIQDVLMIASGGCTALTLQAAHPTTKFTLVDMNEAQIQLVQRKIHALRTLKEDERKFAFNIGKDNPKGLNACGNFEALFRGFKNFLEEFVLAPSDLRHMFSSTDHLSQAMEVLFKSPYWQVAFELFFSEALLKTMFGPLSIQHGPSGSYPSYFQRVIEAGLQRPTALTNYFLHHVFLGYYLDQPNCLPGYLIEPLPDYHFQFVHGKVDQVKDIERYQLISLSNILDWMESQELVLLAQKLGQKMSSGSILVFRQLNHRKELESVFKEWFEFEDVSHHLVQDQSLFYSRLTIGRRR